MSLPLVAIIGRPNVGKSTLFNRLAGRDRALVAPMPGVTRDLHYAEVVFQGKRFTLVDTGGLSTVHIDELTAEVNAQVQFAIESAEVIVLLMDGREGLNPEDEEIVTQLRRVAKPIYWVVNKVDAPSLEKLSYEFYRLGVPELRSISARENIGVIDLFEHITADFPDATEEEDSQDENRPTRVAFVGAPNVGKSTMINRILGEKRLITSAIPGTTRDAIDVPFTLRDQPYVLIDTAGIRRKGRVQHMIEKFAVVKALQALDRTDIAVLLHDATSPLTDQTLHVLSYAEERGRGIILLFNKIDLVEQKPDWLAAIKHDLGRRLVGLDWVPVMYGSAETGKGLKKLFETIPIVRENQLRRLQTGPLNRYLEEAVAHHGAPMSHNRPLKFYYMTQAIVRPPSFVIFTNNPAGVHFSYRRYLVNRLRDFAPFEGTPIRLMFRGKKKERA
jgi:GTP-binding protein